MSSIEKLREGKKIFDYRELDGRKEKKGKKKPLSILISHPLTTYDLIIGHIFGWMRLTTDVL